MSSTSKLDAALGVSWRAATAKAVPSIPAGRTTAPVRPATPSSHAVFYTQQSGADLFPGKDLVKAILRKLRRA